jgi:hypothetical protein
MQASPPSGFKTRRSPRNRSAASTIAGGRAWVCPVDAQPCWQPNQRHGREPQHAAAVGPGLIRLAGGTGPLLAPWLMDRSGAPVRPQKPAQSGCSPCWPRRLWIRHNRTGKRIHTPRSCRPDRMPFVGQKAREDLFETLGEHAFGIGTIAGFVAKSGVHRRLGGNHGSVAYNTALPGASQAELPDRRRRRRGA